MPNKDAQRADEEQRKVTGALEGDTVYAPDGVGGANHLPAGNETSNGGYVSGGESRIESGS